MSLKTDRRTTELVRINIGGASLVGDLTMPERPRGLVLFAHGSGSSRLSPRNQFVAETLNDRRLATLLLVGEWDEPVIAMNRDAMQQMHAPVRLEIVPRATHLFEEPGALERVAALAGEWFDRYLTE